MKNNQKTIWFPKPEIDDPTYCQRDEHILDWLSRSTIQRAVSYRKILNYHLSKVPKKSRDHFLNTARDHWNSAIFEVIVGRFLQELGAKLIVEKEIDGGTRPDYLASFTDGSIIVEATAPEINNDVEIFEKLRNPLLIIIESKIPPGWDVGVNQLPQIGLSDSKKEFSRIIEEIFSSIEVIEDQDIIEIVRHFDSGDIDLTLIKRSKSTGIIAFEPAISLWDNTEYRIRKALRNKKSQVSKADLPVILAVHASGITSDWEDFDKSLFGHTVEKYDQKLQKIGNDFSADGYLLKQQRETLIYAGVLAFINVDLPFGNDPVLYTNPFYKENFPSSFVSLEQKCFDVESKLIFSIPAQTRNIMEKIRKDALA